MRLIWLIAIALLAFPASARDYYVSSTTGDDRSSGVSTENAWQSLARASAASLEPGDRILLRAGERFAGQLVIPASGGEGKPIVVSRYGEGAKPLIDGDGHAAAILIRNREHIEISDLEIVNTVNRPHPGSPVDWAFGILVLNEGGGVLEHFRLERLTIHDVFAPAIDHSSEDAFNRVSVSAIRFQTAAAKPGAKPSFFRDIVIARNAISRTGRFGVLIGHEGTRGAINDAHSRDPETGFNRDVVVRDNRFEDLGGSAVQVGGARMLLIENNDFLRTGSSLVPGRMVGRGSGAWVINCRDVVAQHNRSRSVRGYKDSYGMHVDFGNRDVIYQYNYSEDSEGGFVEILGANRNVTWRYNISVNDGLREKDGNTIWLSPWSPQRTKSTGIHIHHNTVYVRSGLYPDLDFRVRDASIRNNLFVVAREAMVGEDMRVELADGGRLDVAGNLFAGRVNARFRELDGQPMAGDPELADPGLASPEGYRIARTSAAAGSGANVNWPAFPAAGKGVFRHVSERPSVDFFGRTISPEAPPTVGAALPD